MVLVIIILLLIFPFKIHAQTDTPYAENRILVKYKKGQTKSELQNAVNLRTDQAKTTLGKISQKTSDFTKKLTGVRFPEEKLQKIEAIEEKYSLDDKLLSEEISIEQSIKSIDIPSAIADFRSLDAVEKAEPDYRRRPFFIPNDTYYPDQWALFQIHIPEAWDITQGDSSGNVLIAIIDTGVSNTHPDLLSSKVIDYYNCASISGCTAGGDDTHGHGTHVAGIASAVTNNAEGVAGVAFNTKLISLKVDDIDGIIYDSYIISALDKLITTYPSKKVVINLSLGGPFSDVILEDAINRAWNAGFVIVAASGNCGNNTDPNNQNCNGQTNPVMYPAGYQNTIAVAATTNNDQKASYSEFGNWVDVSAPGGDVCTGTTDCIISTYPPNNYAIAAGTSMASPHVAGVAALVWSTNIQLTNDQVRNKLQSSADVISGTGTYWMNGRVNAFNAVNLVSNDVGDLTYLIDKFGTNDANADLNNSGKVNTLDLSILLANFGN